MEYLLIHNNMSSDFGPVHPAFWAGQWHKNCSYPTFENYHPPDGTSDGYLYQAPYWSSNYFYRQTSPARWGSPKNYRGLWNRYYRTWDWDLARNPL